MVPTGANLRLQNTRDRANVAIIFTPPILLSPDETRSESSTRRHVRIRCRFIAVERKCNDSELVIFFAVCPFLLLKVDVTPVVPVTM